MNRVEVLTPSCPAGTPQSAPVEIPFTFAFGPVKKVEIRIPPGHAFLTGIQLAQAHVQTVPFTTGQFLIGDDERLEYELDDQLANGAWSVFMFNTDRNYAHLWQVRWLVLDQAPTLPSRGTITLPVAAIHEAAPMRLPGPGAPIVQPPGLAQTAATPPTTRTTPPPAGGLSDRPGATEHPPGGAHASGRSHPARPPGESVAGHQEHPHPPRIRYPHPNRPPGRLHHPQEHHSSDERRPG